MLLKDTIITVGETLPVSIESGTSMTGTVNLGGLRLFGIIVPPEWTEANISFQMSPDTGDNWFEICDTNGEPVVTLAAAESYFAVDPRCFASIQYLRLRSGEKGAEISQAGDRTLQLILRKV